MLELIVLIAIVLIAYLGSRHSFQRQIFQRGLYYFFLTGTEYILLGWFLGNQFLKIIDEELIRNLSPFITFILSLVGFLAGSQFEWRRLKRFPTRLYGATLLIDLMSFLVVTGGFWAIQTLHPFYTGNRFHLILILSICAVGTAPASTMMVLNRFRRFHQLSTFLQFVSGFGDLIMICLIGILFSYEDNIHQTVKMGHIAGIYWMFFSILMGVIMGVAFYTSLNIRQSKNEYFALLIGLVALTGGVSAYLHLSPIFVSAIAGLVYANLPRVPGHAWASLELAKVERPFYLILLCLSGALIYTQGHWVIALAPLYVLFRAVGKVSGGWLIHRLFPAEVAPPQWIGLGLMAQGGTAIAVIVSYQMGYHDEPGIQPIVAIVLLGVIFSELISPTLLNYICHREQDQKRKASDRE